MKLIPVTPANDIDRFVHRITVFKSPGTKVHKQKLTPSPFTCISYNHYDVPDFLVGGKPVLPKSRLQITGPKTSNELYALHKGKLHQILIELSPSSFYYIFRTSPAGIVNTILPLSQILQEGKVNDLLSSLSENSNYRSHLKKLKTFLLSLVESAYKPVEYIDRAIEIIEGAGGNISVDTLCDKIYRSERQLDRKFKQIVGISPIQYIKIRQLHHLINLIYLKHYTHIKELAYDMGFYDPAHLSNFFKKLTGMSPGEFIDSKDHVALDYFAELV